MKAEKQALCLLVFYLTLCLWLGGCTEKQEVGYFDSDTTWTEGELDLYDLSDVRNAVIDTITTVGDGLQISGTGHGPGLIIKPVQPCLPCPDTVHHVYLETSPVYEIPCPDTVYLYQPHAHENADSVIYRTSSTWYYNYMPKGTWVKVEKTETGRDTLRADDSMRHCTYHRFLWPDDFVPPDSAFILKDND